MNHEDVALELARIVRECEAAVSAKLRACQLGEAFVDLPKNNLEKVPALTSS